MPSSRSAGRRTASLKLRPHIEPKEVVQVLGRYSARMSENLNGSIERVPFHNPENSFAVLPASVRRRDDLVSIVGKTTSVIGSISRQVGDRGSTASIASRAVLIN